MSTSAPTGHTSVPWRAGLGVVTLGGMVGAGARWAVQEAWPDGGLPWATITVNVLGCLAIGWLTVWARRRGAELLRLGVGVGGLGGFTTFSAYAVDVQQLLLDDRVLAAALVLFGTLVAALLAVAAGSLLGEWLLGPRATVGRR